MLGRFKYVVIGLLVLGVVLVGVIMTRPRGKDFQRPGLPMTERLALAEAVQHRTNTFFRGMGAEHVREQALAAGSAAERLRGMIEYGYFLILDGRTEQAIEALKGVRRDLESSTFAQADEFRNMTSELLMVAYLRLGEQQNCLLNHNADSCLFPISGDGVHVEETGSRMAINEMNAILLRNPHNINCVWLLNLAYMTLGEYPHGVPPKFLIPPRVFESHYQVPRSYDIAASVGLDVMGLSGGVIMDDFDNDGLLDLVISAWGLHEQLRYFRNNGDGSFDERTESAGLLGQTGGLNLVSADYDNDGWLDFLVLRGAWLYEQGDYPNSLLRNHGDGTFTDVTEEAGVLSFLPTQTAAWGDFDNDGRLDLFIGNESFAEADNRCELYRNNGDGTFSNVAAEVGLDHRGYVKAAVWGDYDNDGLIDLYLSQYEDANALYRNAGSDARTGRWRFEEVTLQAGVLEPRSSFPAWFFDYDNDGWLDLLVGPSSDFFSDNLSKIARDYLHVEQDADRCVLYHNNGDGTFTDVAPQMNINKVLLAMGSNYGDLDNDGWLDCYFGTGEPGYMTLVPNRMFRNNEGRYFQDVTTAGGFGNVQKGHGIAFGDLDRDGDQDIYAVMGGAYSGDVYPNALYENPGNDNHWITMRLEGVKANRCAIGARIRLDLETPSGDRSVHLLAGSGGSFGASSLQQEAGLGDATALRSITITWPGSGTVDVIENVAMDRIVRIVEGEGIAHPVESSPFKLGDDRDSGDHHHHH